MIQRFLVVLAAAALAAGCGGGGDEEAGSPTAVSSEPIRLAVGVDPVFTPIFLAADQGLFEKEGLKVEVQQFSNAGEAADALVAGAADVAGVPDYNLLSRATRTNFAALGVFAEDLGQYVKVVVRGDLSNPRAIKKMGIVPGTFSEYAATRFLQSLDVDPASVKFVPSGPPELPPLLQGGDVDAFVLWEPWPTRARDMGGKVLMPIQKFGLGTVLMLSTTDEWVEGHRAEAEALMRALKAAAQMTEQDPAAAAKVTATAAKIPEALTEQAVGELEFRVRAVTDADRQDFEKIVDFLVERDVLKRRPVLDDIVVQGFVPGS
jgi:ABC-type nitrate/sulfonate/bicarbonate transport system substrate-binding protein